MRQEYIVIKISLLFYTCDIISTVINIPKLSRYGKYYQVLLDEGTIKNVTKDHYIMLHQCLLPHNEPLNQEVTIIWRKLIFSLSSSPNWFFDN